jgi:hypothetical protein
MEREIFFNVGQDNFRNLRESCGYYIDKSQFISELVRARGHVNLITRPRRFGKTMNLSMLESFFEIGADPSLTAWPPGATRRHGTAFSAGSPFSE